MVAIDAVDFARRAAIALKERSWISDVVPDLDELIGDSPAANLNFRLNSLANCAAWHSTRQDATARLEAFEHELARFQRKTADSNRESSGAQLFDYLSEHVGPGREAYHWRANVLDDLTLAEGEREHWANDLDLMVVQETLRTLRLLLRGKSLRKHLKGTVVWE